MYGNPVINQQQPKCKPSNTIQTIYNFKKKYLLNIDKKTRKRFGLELCITFYKNNIKFQNDEDNVFFYLLKETINYK